MEKHAEIRTGLTPPEARIKAAEEAKPQPTDRLSKLAEHATTRAATTVAEALKKS